METKLFTLKDLVNANDVNVIIEAPNGLQEHRFDVGTTEYDLKEHWIVKGHHEVIVADDGARVLYCEALEDPTGTPAQTPEIALAEKLDEAMSIPVHAFVFHRGTLTMAGKEVKKKHVNAFAHACIKSYNVAHPEVLSPIEDFAVFEVDFANKHVELKSINPEE